MTKCVKPPEATTPTRQSCSHAVIARATERPRSKQSYCQKLCMGLSCGGAILAFSIHEFDASNDLGELI